MREHLVSLLGKKKHVRVQNAIRRLCAAAAAITVISLFSIYIHRQMKRTRENFLPFSPRPPTTMRACDPSRFIFLNRIHREQGKAEEVLLCSALSVSPIISRVENEEKHTDWPRSLGESTLHNANCTSATITFLY